MKKFYAFAAAAIAAVSMNAQTVVTLAGGYNGWDAKANPMTETATAGVYEISVDKLTKEFKVVVTEGEGEAAVTTWYGVPGGAIELDTPTAVAAGDEGANIVFANGWDAVSDAKVTFDYNATTITVSGKKATVEVHYGIHGSFATGEWATTNMNLVDGLWVATFTFDGEAAPGVGEFGIKQMDENDNQLGWIAGSAAGIEITEAIEDIEVSSVDCSNMSVNLPKGEWTFSFNAEELLLSVYSGAAGIDEILSGEAVPAVYYNLQGVKVANPENGIYVVRQGNKVSKVLVK